jgi:hypothetical protein
VHLEQMTLESWDNLDRTSTPGWPRHQCQTDADATKAEGADAGDEARDVRASASCSEALSYCTW